MDTGISGDVGQSLPSGLIGAPKTSRTSRTRLSASAEQVEGTWLTHRAPWALLVLAVYL